MFDNAKLQLANLLTENVNKIVMYHKFSNLSHNIESSSKLFEQQLIYITKAFKNKILSSPNSRQTGIHLTIDDGYQDFYDLAYPLLVKYEVPATFYVCTGFINKELWMWYDKIEYLLETTSVQYFEISLAGQPHAWSLTSKIEKENCALQLQSILKSFPSNEVSAEINAISQLLEIEIPVLPPYKYSACSWEQLRDMDPGLVNIGAHSHTHPILTNCTDEQLSFELKHCTELLQKELQRPIKHFCYPNGQSTDYSNTVIEKLKQLGYESAVTAFTDGYNCKDRYKIRRCSGVESIHRFKKHVNGVEHLSKKWTSFKTRNNNENNVFSR